MNALVRAGRDPELPSGIAEPEMSYELRSIVTSLIEDASRKHLVSDDHRREAAEVLPAFGQLCSIRASQREHHVAFWLRRLNLGATFALDPAGLTAMLESIVTASGDLPAGVFNQDTLASALRTIDRISAAKVDALLRPIGLKLMIQWRMVKMIAGPLGGRGADQARPATEEERQKVTAMLRRARAEIAAQAPLNPPAEQDRPARSRFVSDGELLEICRADAVRLLALPAGARERAVLPSIQHRIGVIEARLAKASASDTAI